MAQRRRREVSRNLSAGSEDYRRAIVPPDARNGGQNRRGSTGDESDTSNSSGVRRSARRTGNGSSRSPVVATTTASRSERLKVDAAFNASAADAYESFVPGHYNVKRNIRENLVLHKMEQGPETSIFRDDEGDLSVLHVSDVQNKCLRRMQLSHRFGVKMIENPIWASMGITFAIGHTIEAFVRQRVLLKSPKTVYGDWRCRCGAYKLARKTGAEIKDYCEHCSTKPDIYTGLMIKNEEAGIIGNVDLAFMINEAVYIVEVKSIKGEYWHDLGGPKPMHRQQVCTYWFMAAEDGLPMSEQVSVIYVNKEYMFGNPFKEYAVKPLQKRNPIMAHEIFEKAKLFHSRKAEGHLFNRIADCSSADTPTAKRCDQCLMCFELDEPERETDA